MRQRTSYIGQGHELIAILDESPNRKFLVVMIDEGDEPGESRPQTPDEAERRIGERFGTTAFSDLLPPDEI